MGTEQMFICTNVQVYTHTEQMFICTNVQVDVGCDKDVAATKGCDKDVAVQDKH